MNIFPDSLVMAQTCNKGHEGLCHGVPSVCVPGSEHRYRGQEEMGLIPDSQIYSLLQPLSRNLGLPQQYSPLLPTSGEFTYLPSGPRTSRAQTKNLGPTKASRQVWGSSPLLPFTLIMGNRGGRCGRWGPSSMSRMGHSPELVPDVTQVPALIPHPSCNRLSFPSGSFCLVP